MPDKIRCHFKRAIVVFLCISVFIAVAMTGKKSFGSADPGQGQARGSQQLLKEKCFADFLRYASETVKFPFQSSFFSRQPDLLPNDGRHDGGYFYQH
jgi:hypothetical protein